MNLIEIINRVFSFMQPDCRSLFHPSEITQRTGGVQSRLNRIEAFAESILRHIEEALQERDDRSDRAFGYVAIWLEEAGQCSSLRYFPKG